MLAEAGPRDHFGRCGERHGRNFLAARSLCLDIDDIELDDSPP
jgi:hypothetical protein